MFDIYLIEMLDSVCFGFIIAVMAFIALSIFYIDKATDIYIRDTENKIKKENIKKRSKKCIYIASLFLILFILTPSTKIAYKIIGIGGTIDYLRKNETAKQLPDKCIKALNEITPDQETVKDTINNK